MSPDNFTQGHLMKIEWFITSVTAVESLDRAERAILGGILVGRFFLPIQAIFVVGEPLCDVGTPSRTVVTLLRAV